MSVLCHQSYAESYIAFVFLSMHADGRYEGEKRMVVIQHADKYDAWLYTPAARSMEFMWQFPAHLLISTPEPERGKRQR